MPFFVSVPATYPRRLAGDALLATGSAPSPEAALPPEWQDWPEADDYRISPDGDLKGDTDRYLADLKEIAAERFAISKRAVEEHDPELLFTLFSSTDWLLLVLSIEERFDLDLGPLKTLAKWLM